ncbi:Alpha/beta hydrolase fold-1 [Mycena sanguinolenta]|nr:Alpha/beta hydrolase fold-1 [Mycena sanguinolenta]
MSTAHFNITPLVLDCPPQPRDPPGHVLKMTAKRYWTAESASNEEGFSVLFAHCIGSHKESWEPTIFHTFRSQQALNTPRHLRMREAWAVDWQNHGEAAVLNRAMLEEYRKGGVSVYEWADALAAFVRSPRLQGRRIVGVGHSAGAGAMVLALQTHPFTHALLLIEPTIATPAFYHATMAAGTPALEAATLLRRDRWPSRRDAADWMKRKLPSRKWDKGVLDLFIEHGLTDTPDGSVKLKCDRRQEALAFPDVHPHFDAAAALARMMSTNAKRGGRGVQVHLVWARGSELIPKAIQDALSGTCAGASVTKVEGGHSLPQESPLRVAHALVGVLGSVGVGADAVPPERSRL